MDRRHAYMEEQTEGQAFLFSHLKVHKRSENNATALEYMFDTSEEPRGYAHYNYCAAKAILQADINGAAFLTTRLNITTIRRRLSVRQSTSIWTRSREIVLIRIRRRLLSVQTCPYRRRLRKSKRCFMATPRTTLQSRLSTQTVAYARWLILIARESQFGIYSSHTLVPRRGFLTLSIKSAMTQLYLCFARGRESGTARKDHHGRLASASDRQRSLSRITRTPTKKNGTKVRQNFTAPKIATALPSLLAATREYFLRYRE